MHPTAWRQKLLDVIFMYVKHTLNSLKCTVGLMRGGPDAYYGSSPKSQGTNRKELALSGQTTFSYRASPETREGFRKMDCSLIHKDPNEHELFVAFRYVFNPGHLKLQLQLGVCAVVLLIAFIIAAWPSHTGADSSCAAPAQ